MDQEKTSVELNEQALEDVSGGASDLLFDTRVCSKCGASFSCSLASFNNHERHCGKKPSSDTHIVPRPHISSR